MSAVKLVVPVKLAVVFRIIVAETIWFGPSFVFSRFHEQVIEFPMLVGLQFD